MLRQSRVGIPPQRDQCSLQALEDFHESYQLFGFTAVGNSQHLIACNDHADITVNGLRWMQEDGRGLGARQSCSVFRQTMPDLPIPVTTTRPR